MTGQRNATDLARMLAAQATDLVHELLPTGKRAGAEWRCGDLSGKAGQSLAVRLSGARAGVWSDFATGERGDALDLVAAVLFGGDVKAAMAWAQRWLGLENGLPVPATTRRVPATLKVRDDAEARARRRKALALFSSAIPSIAGTPVEAYLAARSIPLRNLGRVPAALRFHPTCFNAEAGQPMPAMLASITGGGGDMIAIHRTWLAQDAMGIWRKAALATPKKVMGGFVGGAIRLWRGGSGMPLDRAPQGEAVALAEGIETALSVAVVMPELRVMAAVSVGNLANVVLPSAVGTVILCADDDGDNAASAAALDRAVSTFVAQGRDVRIALPPSGKDFNDALREIGGSQ
jgi:hypothetical protein